MDCVTDVRRAIWQASARVPQCMPMLPQERKKRSGVLRVEPITVTVCGNTQQVTDQELCIKVHENGAALSHWLNATAQTVAQWMGNDWAALCTSNAGPDLQCVFDEHLIVYGDNFTPIVAPDWSQNMVVEAQLRPQFEITHATKEVCAQWRLRACKINHQCVEDSNE